MVDRRLGIEACRLEGSVRPLPKHFHDYLVIGLVEEGERCLQCGRREYTIGKGSLLLLNPGDIHACTQRNQTAFSFRSLHVPADLLLDLAEETTGRRQLLGFPDRAPVDSNAARLLSITHSSVAGEQDSFCTEELMHFLLLAALGRRFSSTSPHSVCRQEIAKACSYLREHFAERITLETLSREVNLSKSALLRAFSKNLGISPYSYLLSVRVGRAAAFLRQGATPAQTAQLAGFADQSHLTNCFARLTGLTPGSYRMLHTAQPNVFSEGAAHA